MTETKEDAFRPPPSRRFKSPIQITEPGNRVNCPVFTTTACAIGRTLSPSGPKVPLGCGRLLRASVAGADGLMAERIQFGQRLGVEGEVQSADVLLKPADPFCAGDGDDRDPEP